MPLIAFRPGTQRVQDMFAFLSVRRVVALAVCLTRSSNGYAHALRRFFVCFSNVISFPVILSFAHEMQDQGQWLKLPRGYHGQWLGRVAQGHGRRRYPVTWRHRLRIDEVLESPGIAEMDVLRPIRGIHGQSDATGRWSFVN